MKKIIFLLLSPMLLLAQTDLVKWDGPVSATPNVLQSNISAGTVSGSNFNTLHYAGFHGTQWPAGNTVDTSKYIQLSVGANTNYQISLNTLKFAYVPYDGTQSCGKYQVRYSFSPVFADGGVLLHDDQNASASTTN